MKSLLIALALLASVPAFADEAQDVSAADSVAQDADLRIDFGPGGIGIGWAPGRGPRWGRPGRPPMVQCVAQNGRGMNFFGRAWDDNRAAGQAMHQCRTNRFTMNPRTCRVVHCNYVR